MQGTERMNNHDCQCVHQHTENKQGSCGLCRKQEVLKTISRSLSVFVLVLTC
jgi:hypothetical protein